MKLVKCLKMLLRSDRENLIWEVQANSQTKTLMIMTASMNLVSIPFDRLNLKHYPKISVDANGESVKINDRRYTLRELKKLLD